MKTARFISVALSLALFFQLTASSPAQSAGVLNTSPGLPRNPTVVDSNYETLTLAWSAPFANPTAVVDYEIRYSEDSGQNWQIYEDGISTTTTIDLVGLTQEKEYLIEIRSVGTFANSSWVDFLSAEEIRPVKVVNGPSHTCVLYSSGEVGCWGQYPAIDTISTTPQIVEGISNAVDIAVGYDSTCALLASMEIFCFGENSNGHLGNGTSGIGNRTLTPTKVTGIDSAVSLDMLGHSCAVLTNKTIKCWGPNSSGQLGDNSLVLRPEPVTVSGISDAVQVGVGYGHSCALLEDGKVKCWGMNESGQLGNGKLTDSKTPVFVQGISNAISLDVGGAHSCAILATKEIKCWGLNRSGQVDRSLWPLENVVSPNLVPGISNAISLGIGHSHSCALLETQRIKCWGNNSYYALGNGSQDWPLSPTEVIYPGVDFAQVSSGVLSSCVLYVHHEVGCWGNNDSFRAQISLDSGWMGPVGFSAFNFARNSFSLPATVSPPSNISLSSRTKNSLSIYWNSPDPNNLDLSYKVEWSIGDGNWFTSQTSETTHELVNLNKATKYLIRITSITSKGESNPSSPISFFTTGTRAMRFEFLDSNGDPIVGGSVGWALDDGTFRSSKKYGITDNGVLDFPLVAAGSGKLTVNGIMTSQGGTVSGEWNYDFGSIPEPFVIPSEFSNSSWDIEVLLPNGLPLVGADVEVFGLDSEGQVAEREFKIDLKSSGKTDERGIFTAKGFGLSNISARVTYDDGVLVQSKTADLVSAHTTLMVDEMPWIALDDDSTTANFGTLVPVPISVQEDVAPLFAKVNRAIGLSNAGVSVQIIPPKGAKQNCKGKVLKSKTNGSGEAVLKVCATKSGTYLIKGSGAAPTEGLFLKVKGASPMPVTSASAKSPEFGRMNISWNPPLYNGGSKIIKYKVKIVGGGKVYSKETKSKSIVFSGLKNATRYKATITAVSANGESDPVVITAGVA